MYRRSLYSNHLAAYTGTGSATAAPTMSSSTIVGRQPTTSLPVYPTLTATLLTPRAAAVDADNWQPVPTNRAHKWLTRFNWALAANDAKMPQPTQSDAASLDWATVGTADTIGRRDEMEDVVVVQTNTMYNGVSSTHRLWLCAVLDGHGGREASLFVGSRWPSLLFDTLALVREPLTPEKIRHAVVISLRRCNSALEQALLGAPDVGTTLCAALVVDGRLLYVVNVGDSRCVAVRAHDGAYRALSRDHKPSRADELQRIVRLGGSVLMCDGVARVGGNLSLSRALGDFGSAPYISGEPEISGPHDVAEIGAVALVCDGVTDVLGDSQIGALIGALVPSHGAQHAAAALRDAAYVFGSGDNISAVVLNLAAIPTTTPAANAIADATAAVVQ